MDSLYLASDCKEFESSNLEECKVITNPSDAELHGNKEKEIYSYKNLLTVKITRNSLLLTSSCKLIRS